MSKKPRPRREIAVVDRIDGVPVETLLVIQTTTPDATNWVIENLSEFGRLSVWEGGRFHLKVFPQLYDIDEAVVYIESMGE